MRKVLQKGATGALVTVISAGMLLAGCSKEAEKPVQGSTEKETTQTDTKTNPETPAKEMKLNKDAKIRIAVPDNAGVKGFEQGTSTNDNPFLNAIKEKTGYTNIEWNVIPAANQLETYNLMFASGDVYDLIYTTDLTIFKRFGAQGALLPVEPLLEQYGDEVSRIVTEDAWTAVTMDGKKLAIPVPPYSKYEDIDLGFGFLARQDWMDQLGLQAPKNLEELYTFLKTIKEKDPSGKGTIPYVAAAGNNGNPLDGLDVITAAFGMSGISNLAVPFVVKDGQLVDAQDLYLKDMLTYLNKLYSEGLIDNEYLFNKTQQVTEKMTSGKGASTFAGYWDPAGYLTGLSKTDPDAKLSFLPTVQGNEGQQGYSMPAPVSNFYIIPKNAKNANEAVDLLNSYLKDKDLQKYVNYGEEGVHYEMVQNVLTPIKPAYDQIIYKLYYRMWNSPDIWLPNAIMGGYEPAMKSFVEAGPQLTTFNINHYRPQTEAELAKGRALIDLRNEYVAKIINGALPLTAVDEYLKKADDAGRQEVLQASQEWFAKEGKAINDKLNK